MSEYRNYEDDFIIESSNYGKHVSAMTGEQLHSKSDIAAELAYRDDRIEQLELDKAEYEQEVKISSRKLRLSERKIEQLERENAELEVANKALRQNRDQYKREAYAVAAHVEQLNSALEPFAFEGICGLIHKEIYSVMQDRVKDWLGVSDFKRAKIAFDKSPKTSLAEVRAKAVEDFVDNDLRNACLANGWGTDTSAYEVHLMLNDYAQQIRNSDS